MRSPFCAPTPPLGTSLACIYILGGELNKGGGPHINHHPPPAIYCQLPPPLAGFGGGGIKGPPPFMGGLMWGCPGGGCI